MDTHMPPPSSSDSSLARRSAVVVAIAVLIIVFVLFLWYATDVLLLAFAGALLGVFLRGSSGLLRAHFHIPFGVALAIVLLVIIVAIGLLVWLLAPQVAQQAGQLAQQLPQAIDQLRHTLKQGGWLNEIIPSLPRSLDSIRQSGNLLARTTGIVSTTLDALFSLFVFVSVGIYIAADPGTYTAGILHLLPFGQRDRAKRLLSAIHDVLWWWLVGRFMAMIFIAVLTYMGLRLLGVPLTLTLAVLAGVLNFVPNFGPIASAIPAVLLALLQGPATAGYVLLLYVGIQVVESYVLTPLLQQRMVSVPPVLTILGQVLMGILAGTIGLVLATPLLAAAVVTAKVLYVQDTLGDKVPLQAGDAGS